MEGHVFLIQLVLILFSARLFGEIVAHFEVPSVIGELLAGIVIGPSLLGWIELSPPIHLLAQVGIILLLFEVGIESDISRLVGAGSKAAIVAICGVVFPFVFGVAISYGLFNFSLLTSLFIGSTLTATSIGITLRVLGDLKQQGSPEAQVILGAAVIDDIIGIVFLAVLFEFANSGTVDAWNAGKVLLFIALFFLLAPIAAKLIAITIKKWEETSVFPGLLPTMIVSLILLFAWIAYSLGAPELLGGFAAGLALSRQFSLPMMVESKEFAHKVEKQMKPIVYLFTPIFFVSIGLSLNLREIDWSSSIIWLLSGSLIVAAVVGKLLSGFCLFKESRFVQLAIGLAMIPRGEVGLIFAGVGLATKVLDESLYAALIIVIAVTTVIPPFFLRMLYRKNDMDNRNHRLGRNHGL